MLEKMRGLVVLLVVMVGVGCGPAFSAADSGGVRYTNWFRSEPLLLSNGLTVVIDAEEMKKWRNPLAQAFGALGPEDTDQPVELMARFQNSSQAPITVTPLEICSRNCRQLRRQQVTLQPGQQHKSWIVKDFYSIWGGHQDFKITINFDCAGYSFSEEITLNRKTVQEHQELLKGPVTEKAEYAPQ